MKNSKKLTPFQRQMRNWAIFIFIVYVIIFLFLPVTIDDTAIPTLVNGITASISIIVGFSGAISGVVFHKELENEDSKGKKFYLLILGLFIIALIYPFGAYLSLSSKQFVIAVKYSFGGYLIALLAIMTVFNYAGKKWDVNYSEKLDKYMLDQKEELKASQPSSFSQPIQLMSSPNNRMGTRINADRIFDTCLLLVTVLAAAIIAYATYVYPLNGVSSNLTQVNYIFRVTTIIITSMIGIWIGSSLIPAPTFSIGLLGKFRRRFVKEFCWSLFGNLFAFEILAFVYFAFSTEMLTAFLAVDYSTLAAFFLTFPATWHYTQLDKIETTKKIRKLNWLKSKLTHPITEHLAIYLIAFLIVRQVILFSGTVPAPTFT